MKIGIIGAGAVGAACLVSVVMRGVAEEVILINRSRKRADGVITDVQYGATLSPFVRLRVGEYGDLKGSALVIITAGVNEKTGGATDRSDPKGRLKLLQTNAEVYRAMVPQIAAAAPEAPILVVTDPPDALANLALQLAGHPRVLSTGTYLDSLRFRFHLGRRLKVNPQQVEAQVVGEHGTSQVFLWSSARVAGSPLAPQIEKSGLSQEQFQQEIEKEVRYANITIIEGTGASVYGIGMVTARIAEMILRDEQAVIPIGSFNSKYGTTISLPSVVGRNGVSRILEPEMSGRERELLEKSAQTLREASA
jgi:L-lactate dehydrogenase